MKCNFNREDIIDYAEGGLSQEKTAEIKRHLDNCEECRSYYGLMTLSASYASREAHIDKFFYEKVIGNLDSNRYKERKIKYSLGKFLSIISPVLKPAVVAAALCIVALLIGMNVQQIGDFMNSQVSNKIAAGNNQVEENDNKYTPEPTPVTTSVKTAAKNRPETKSGYLSIEGMNEEHRFNLVKCEPLEFSTYISDDMVAEPLMSTPRGDMLFIYANYSGKLNRDVFIRFYSPGNDFKVNTVDEMRMIVEQDFTSEGFTVENVSDSNAYFYPYSEVELRAKMKDGEKGVISCGISLFKRGGRIYQIMYRYPMEFEEGFSPRVKKVLIEIIWDDGLSAGEATKEQ